VVTQEQLQHHCREKAFYAFGTTKLFDRRMRRLDIWRKCITYLGIIVPLMIGSVVLSFGKDWLPYVLYPAGFVSTIQLALSVWSIVAKWDDKYSYALSALQSQTKLFNEWDHLAKRCPTNLEQRVDLLDAEDRRQEQADIAQNISEIEKRYAMRSALYQFGKQCVRCKVKPVSMKPLDCDTCGNF
jgi:mobilome CxxCx(11)CxxC protein